MKKFKIYGVDEFEDGEIVTYKEIIKRRRGGWLEKSWNGTVAHFEEFNDTWKIIRVKRRFKIVGLGSYWIEGIGALISGIKIGDVYKKKDLLFDFKEHLLKWDGSITDLNDKLGTFYGIPSSRIIFEEIYVEVEDK